MTQPPRSRLSASDRRDAILGAASFVFAEHGFVGATTQMIARRAKISEALLYRHFASKEALYRAVLRNLLRRQDEALRAVRRDGSGARPFVASIRRYLEACVVTDPGSLADTANRVMIASLASDGRYARIIYRRALRIRGHELRQELERAAADGHLTGRMIDPVNAFLFISHVGGMLQLGRGERAVIPYAGDAAALVRDALFFCARGFGLPEAMITDVLGEDVTESLAKK